MKGWHMVCLTGEGDKAFFLGVMLGPFMIAGIPMWKNLLFIFSLQEYRMNITMHLYPKPILAYMDGIVMGGGVGIGVYS